MSEPDALTLDSAVSRDQFVRLHRRLLRRQARVSPWVTIALIALIGLVLLAVDVSVLGMSSRIAAGTTLLIAGGVALLLWRQPYQLWTRQAKLLGAPGTLTLDDSGVHRVVPGGVDARVPWSSVESTVDVGDVLGLRTSRYSWLMLPLPAEPDVAARARAILAEHAAASGRPR
ncbi:MAG: hypothetical protein WCB04_01060 [Mycobacteriales bacterium]